jgi:AcrR family transcriptional regulator
MKTSKSDTYIIRREEQRKALSSPMRMEILGQFTTLEGMSIAEVAERMGRPPASLYYHFRLLEQVGLLLAVGTRPAGKRQEVLYRPVAPRFAMPARSSGSGAEAAMKTMSTAFRMAERDMEAALTSGAARSDGADRNFFGTRLHARLDRATLAEVNKHLKAIERILMRESKKQRVPEDAQYCSLTLALLPLKGRNK